MKLDFDIKNKRKIKDLLKYYNINYYHIKPKNVRIDVLLQ